MSKVLKSDVIKQLQRSGLSKDKIKTVVNSIDKKFFKTTKVKSKVKKTTAKPKKRKRKLSKEYLDYINGEKWAAIKLDLYHIRGRKCEVCQSTKTVDVHHKTYKNLFNEEPEDLILLCRYHHNMVHKK
jgi:hypothetical protein